MVCAEDVKRLCLQLESKSTKGEHWPRAGTSQQDRGVLVTASRGEASLSPLPICTVAPRWDGRPFCCSSRSIVNTPELSDTTGLPGELSSIQPGRADYQCRGLPLLVADGLVGGGLFHFPFLVLRQSHR